MRHTAVVLLTVVAACSAQQELASTTTPEVATTETPSTTEALPSTTLPETTATTERSTTTTTLEPLESLAYEKVADLLFPVQLTSVPGSKISYIATKDGRIWLYDGISVSDEPVLDINTQVRDEGSVVCSPSHSTRWIRTGSSPTTPPTTVTPWFPSLHSSTTARLTRTRSVFFFG